MHNQNGPLVKHTQKLISRIENIFWIFWKKKTTSADTDSMVDFIVENLHSKVPLKDSLQVIKKMIIERTDLPVNNIIDLQQC